MSLTDRSLFKAVLQGSLTGNRNVSNAADVVAKDAQRFESATVGDTASTAGSDYVFPVARVDRAVMIKEVRVLPAANIAMDGANDLANYVTIAYGYSNDNSGPGLGTTQGSINNKPTANGGVGNMTGMQSVVVAANSNVNQVVPAGSMIAVTTTHSGIGIAIPAGTKFQVLWEEV